MKPLFQFLILTVITISSGFVDRAEAQNTQIETIDTLKSGPASFTAGQAAAFIYDLIGRDNVWRDNNDKLRLALSVLVGHYSEPLDSIRKKLAEYNFQGINISPVEIRTRDTLPLKWLNKTTFIIDTFPLKRLPVITSKTIVMRVLDPMSLKYMEILTELREEFQPLLEQKDTIIETVIDSSYLNTMGIMMYNVVNGKIVPSPTIPGDNRYYRFSSDSAKLIVTKTINVLTGDIDSPFYIVDKQDMPDSLDMAVKTLLHHTYKRDSIELFFYDLDGNRTRIWLSGDKDDLRRYWVKNINNDSVTIWLGNPSKYDITFVLEDEVFIERKLAKNAEYIRIPFVKPEPSLLEILSWQEIPVYWSYGLNNSFALTQSYLSNWVQGGESSLTGLLDINGTALYSNSENNVRWQSTGRIRYGSIRSLESNSKRGPRTSTDIIEINSQYNKKLLSRIDFSSAIYINTQMAKGYKYPNDSVYVSKFLNPATFTIGVGMEYKPFKNTLINLSPLAYKNTFVLDTVNIDQTTFGIDKPGRSRQEMGGQLVLRNKLSIMDGLNINNQLRLFSNYLDKPQNIHVNWEINIDKQISWFFSVRFNFHLIYNDNVRFSVTDKQGEPVLLPDGSPKKVAMAQLNQFLGLSFAFSL